MTMTVEPGAGVSTRSAVTEGSPPQPAAASETEYRMRTSSSHVGIVSAMWMLAVPLCIGLVVIGITPLFAQREQRHLFEAYRAELAQAANESLTIDGPTAITKPPEPGAPVAVLELGSIATQHVVVEGADPSATAVGPGHVPGTAGLGQPGNSVVVGRRVAFGAPFASLGAMHNGDEILVTTRQGQSVYVVDHVGEHRLRNTNPVIQSSATDLYATTAPPSEDPLAQSEVFAEDIYGRTGDTRLTLLASGTASPWNNADAVVVVAKIKGEPYPPTPQAGRSDAQTGRASDGSAWAPMVLAVLFLEAVIAVAVYLYRRGSARSAYVLTAAPLVVGVILVSETITRLLPAWF